MPDLSRYRSLSPRERAVVSVAVLLDGFDSVQYLLSDKDRANALSRAAKDLSSLPLDLRIPLLGTLLRQALEDIG